MKRTTLLILLICSFICHFSPAATVDTVQVYSNIMKKSLKTVVIRPSQYDSGRAYPVVYLLHGYSGNHADWISKAKGFETAADTHNMIIVCPDGGYSSWYWDSPVDAQSQYETYVSKELVSFIDSKYKTIKDRAGRGITGLSMGGHGALYLAFRHQDVFGAAGSMSGGVDIRPFPNNWNMADRLGKYADQPERWEKNTVINMLHLLTPNSLALIIDCGVDDFFFKVNEKLHEQLVYRNIPHDYLVRPGAHNWPYWTNAVQYQLLFMSNYFNKKPNPSN
ncbi:alpha/beta hydrolase [Dyadobacter chenhuakuii]|uniref:Esterase family protein n=1 Tax=Dyadobacter chenhuakuii TaxID=2909339 RepID=A0A9X1Q9G9_9BACT|nr:alpha/beta hydrolase family protein [Dyadobacter chenhuakuii]MCF2492529.1 esterase family protein [Dyadobacter chenhuakuii]MCF2497061.1 esterase family protein [Dyadobacter chenhuakuii]USJ33173.1 esterase family protein [Dyadobacter chenhuakuii]